MNCHKTCNLYLSTLAIIGTFILGLASAVEAVDFGQLEQRRSPGNESSPRQSLLQQRNILWKGEQQDLLFEITSLSESLVWISATSNKLHVSEGNEIGVYPGDLSTKLPGKILSLKANSMPHLPNKVLISATIIQGNRLMTHLLSYNGQTGSLSTFYTTSMETINPLKRFLYSQDYAAGNGWGRSIYQLQTTSSSYERSYKLPLPDDAVLLHMTQISPRIVSYLDVNGDLHLVRGETKLARVDGNFGRSLRLFRHRADQQDHPYNQIRIPPAHLTEGNILAVPDNPPADRGVLGFMGSEVTSSIDLFRWTESELTEAESIGPMNGRILDVEVTEANPNQLLWLRKTSDGTRLEMIDFERIR